MRTVGVCLACLLVLAGVLPVVAGSAREVSPLRDGWRFQFGIVGDAPARPDFDDGAWDQVSVPHSWNRIGGYGTAQPADRDAHQGIGWYRLRLIAPPARTPGERSYLDFGAVGAVADVWVNGVHVGGHAGAFSRFRLDVTSNWKPGAANLIAVKADNSKPAPGSATEDVIPLSGDFFVHGGLYRAVSLITRGDAGVDPLDRGGPGIYARTVEVSQERAEVGVLARLRNQGSLTRGLDLVTTIRDADGREVAKGTQPLTLPPGAAEARTTLAIPSPRLWDGRSDPYLYAVTVDVVEAGRVIDSVVQPLGVRTFRIDPDDGFFLNGRPLKLHGASRHQDRPDKGWALSPEDHAQDMAFFVEIGANAVRQAHYQHADEWSDQADRAGMTVWAELPYVNRPALSGGEGSEALWTNAERQLRELIRQNYNHPSVMMWSLGNEIDSDKRPGPTGEPPVQRPLLKRLQKIAKEEDPSRPTIFADCCEDLTTTSEETLAGTADLVGYNRYFGWYYGKAATIGEDLGAELDRLHAKHPGLPIAVSEYGAGGAPGQHSDDASMAYPNFAGRPQPEEYESLLHERSWPPIRDRRFVFGSWIWAMFDFASEERVEGDSTGLNTKGLVTADRKSRKDAFYYYKAQWNPEPMIHLTGKRHAQRAYLTMDVTAYSNAGKATLSMNGRLVGEAPCVDRVCRWADVALSPGDNAAEATAQVDGTKVSDRAVWTGPAPDDGLRIDVGDLASRVVGGRRFGSDRFAIGGTVDGLAINGEGVPHDRSRRAVEAAEPELYEHWRQGERFAYAIPLPDGCRMVTLHTFATDAQGVLLTVKADGVAALPPLDVARLAGGPLKGLERRFPVTVAGGRTTLEFSATGGPATLAALEIGKLC